MKGTPLQLVINRVFRETAHGNAVILDLSDPGQLDAAALFYADKAFSVRHLNGNREEITRRETPKQ